MKKINQLKAKEEVYKYFQEAEAKIFKKYNVTSLEEDKIRNICIERHEAISKCGDALRKLKEASP